MGVAAVVFSGGVGSVEKRNSVVVSYDRGEIGLDTDAPSGAELEVEGCEVRPCDFTRQAMWGI